MDKLICYKKTMNDEVIEKSRKIATTLTII
jgi:hypothetical protein